MTIGRSTSGTRRCVALAGWLLLAGSVFSVAQTLLTTVSAGTYPVAVAVNAVTNKVYVANQNSSNVTVIDGATNNTATVLTGAGPMALAVNPVTNKIYVVCGGGVTVIDGATNRTSSVSTGLGPFAVAVNAVTNKIYVADYNAHAVTVIDGVTNHTTNINVGTRPYGVAVNSTTNTIFVADSGSGDVAAIDGVTNSVTTITVGANPRAIAVDEITNQVYVANYGSGTVADIDGSTYGVTNVVVGPNPVAIALDAVRNQIFVANGGASSGTIIDGATLTPMPIAAGASPLSVTVDTVTGKVYFTDYAYAGTLTMLDETTGAIGSIGIGEFPLTVAANVTTNTLYVARPIDGVVSVIAGASAAPLQFVPVTPCRIVDTRQPQGPFGGPYLAGGTSRSFAVPQSACGIPATASAYSLNVTVVPRSGPLGFLTIWPSGEVQPVVSTLNSPDGRVKANAAIVPAGGGGAVNVYVSNSSEVILDINGYFQPPGARTLQFYPVPLCRVLDTRGPVGSLGGPYLHRGAERDFPLPAGGCQLPPNALAYSMNFTVVPVGGPVGYLAVWPAGSPQPVVSTLNDVTGTVLANAAIVPAGTDGAIAAYANADTELIGDVNGYFAAPGTGGLSLYPLAPCRVIDTRLAGGPFSGQRTPPVNVAASHCGVPANAQEYVFNATVVPVGSLGYLTLWADGDPRPGVSNLNATDGYTASNMAIVGNHDGESDAYANAATQLILDIASYFAP
ncbi:MAG TPA: YncE family protein [Terriglobales bacterium]|nr:YncE family protein [Terriglobales bacterium]